MHKVYGNAWSVIARFMKGRSNTQLANRYRRMHCLPEKCESWTPEEDALLLELAKLYDFDDIARWGLLPVHRKFGEIRQRYNSLNSVEMKMSYEHEKRKKKNKLVAPVKLEWDAPLTRPLEELFVF